METKEKTYNGMVINGFSAILFNLVMLPTLLSAGGSCLAGCSDIACAYSGICIDVAGVFFSRA